MTTGIKCRANKRQRVPRKWTSCEDEALKAALTAASAPYQWSAIAQHVPNRNAAQCQQRYLNVLQPGLRKGQWTCEEDYQILTLIFKALRQYVAKVTGAPPKCSSHRDNNFVDLVRQTQECKLVWGDISNGVAGRTPKQCRERWVNNLSPLISRLPWSSEEDEKLRQLYMKYPRKWSLIASGLPGRTENLVKNRHKSLQLDKEVIFSTADKSTAKKRKRASSSCKTEPCSTSKTSAVRPKGEENCHSVKCTRMNPLSPQTEELHKPTFSGNDQNWSYCVADYPQIDTGVRVKNERNMSIFQRQTSFSALPIEKLINVASEVVDTRNQFDLDQGYGSAASESDDGSTVWSSSCSERTEEVEALRYDDFYSHDSPMELLLPPTQPDENFIFPSYYSC